MRLPQVGYATDEAEDLNEQQGQDLRQLIKDISNRPNRQRPGEGADPEDAQREVGPCPTAGEDGLQPGSAGGAAGGMPNGVHPSSPAATADHASGSTVVGGGGAAGLVAAMNSVSGGMASSGQGASEGAGSGRLHVTTNRNVTSPTAAGGGTGSPSGQVATAVVHMPLGGMTAAGAAAVAVGQAQLAGQGGTPRLGAVQPAVLTLTTMGRHQQQHQPVHGQCGSPVPAAAAAAAMLEGARQRAQGGSPNVEVTLAAAGPGGTLAAGTLTERGEAPRVPATGITALAVAGAGVSPGPGRGPASRHAATYAAVDVAQRVMRSKDSDSEGRDTAAQRAQVGRGGAGVSSAAWLTPCVMLLACFMLVSTARRLWPKPSPSVVARYLNGLGGHLQAAGARAVSPACCCCIRAISQASRGLVR